MFERLIAFRYLKSPKRQGFVSVIAGFSFVGIMLGVATLIVVTSVMNGFHDELLDKLIGTRGHIFLKDAALNFSVDQETLKDLKQVEHVKSVEPLINRQVIAFLPGQARGVMMVGRAMEKDQDPFIKDKMVVGSYEDAHKSDYILIGARMAEQSRLTIGSQVKLYAPNGVQTPFGTLPKQHIFTVGGVFDVGMYDFDYNVVVMSLSSAQKFLSLPGKINGIEIELKHIEDTAKVQKKIAEAFPRFSVMSWQDMDSKIFQAVQVEKNVMFLLLSIVVVIAVFNIVSGLIMLVKDKTRDIAILRTFGATRNQILGIFFMTGSAIGLIGTLCGAVLGILFAVNIESIRQFLQFLIQKELFNQEVYFLSQLPCKIVWSEIIFIIVMSCTLACLATFYPAKKAAALDPAEALRV